tara:strand:- start:3316 stop:3708 length:393 start_codon:yes stop_codon:yes gene_type:complete
MATVSKKFVDLNPNFEKNPITSDLPLLKNAEAIKFAVKNIVLTTRGDRAFRPYFGSTVVGSLFENFSMATADDIRIAIEDALTAYEPRIKLLDVDVIDDIDGNSLDITIFYRIIGIPLDPQSLNLILERV